jgi:hypothetical protein
MHAWIGKNNKKKHVRTVPVAAFILLKVFKFTFTPRRLTGYIPTIPTP